MTEEVLRVTATDSARALIATLRSKHGDLMFHQSGGCCDGYCNSLTLTDWPGLN